MNTMVNRYLNLVAIESSIGPAGRPSRAAPQRQRARICYANLAFTPDHLEIAILDPFAPMTFAIPAAHNRRSKNEVEPESGNLIVCKGKSSRPFRYRNFGSLATI
jgi:hypothetical protein